MPLPGFNTLKIFCSLFFMLYVHIFFLIYILPQLAPLSPSCRMEWMMENEAEVSCLPNEVDLCWQVLAVYCASLS